jgi:hypothetical protein
MTSHGKKSKKMIIPEARYIISLAEIIYFWPNEARCGIVT